MNVIQSYVSAIGGGHMSLYEVRVWLQIVRRAQDILQGRRASTYVYSDADVRAEHLTIEIEFRDVLPKGSKHYEMVKDAIRGLSSHLVEHYSSSTKRWCNSPLVYNSSIETGTGHITICVARWVYEYILDFAHGYRRYYLESAMRLRKANSIVMYMLTCHLQHPITYRIDILKGITGDADNYVNNGDYVRKVIGSSASELERMGVNGYSYNIIKTGCKVAAVCLSPIKREIVPADDLTAQLPLSAVCDYGLKTYLVQQVGFTIRELGAHKDLLHNFGKMPGWQDKLVEIIERQRSRRAGKGYIINGMRSALKETLPLQYEQLQEI